MRGDHKTKFDFKTNEAFEFYKKEKSNGLRYLKNSKNFQLVLICLFIHEIEYLSYYQKLCFVDHLDQNDLEKIFHYNDLYPSAAELKEAKEHVLKCNIFLSDLI